MKPIIQYLGIYSKKYIKPILLCFLLISFVSLISMIPPYLMKIVIDNGIMQKNGNVIIWSCLVMVAIYCASTGIEYLSIYKLTYLSEYLILDMKKDIMHKLITTPLSFFSSNDKGYILARVNEVNNLKTIFSFTTFKLLISLVEFVICSYILLNINIKLTLIIFAFIPIYYIICKGLVKKINKITTETIEQNAKIAGKIQETINGIQEVKVLNKEKAENKKIDKLNENLTKLSVKQNITLNFTTEIIILISTCISVLILLISGLEITHGVMSIGTYFAYAAYLPKILSPVQNLAMTPLSLQPALVSIERIMQLINLDTEEDDDDKENVTMLKGDIAINNLSFKYKKADEYIFEKINFDIKSGEKVLIIGANGSGKSTLVKLLMGFYTDYEGEILLDNRDIKLLKKCSLRNKIGYISQDIFLFNGTIRDNVLYSLNDDTNENSEQYLNQNLNTVLELSGLKKICDNLALGLFTMVGENGSLLSGGQKQIIAIARIMIKKPDILIFDEATTNIDLQNKEIIKNMIDSTFKDKTCIFISHDEELIYSVDKILDIDSLKNIVRSDCDEKTSYVTV